MNKAFLYTLLDSMSVSGHEIELQKKVIAEMTPHCDKILTDYTGNVISVINPDAPFKVMLAGHIDEIGLIVTNIQSDGMIRVAKAGGIRAGVYPGHQVVIHGENGTVYGAVVHNKAMTKGDLKDGDLIIDIGAKDADEARKYVQEGDPIHLNTYHQELLNGRLCARAIDDRGGAFIILEALKRAKERGCRIGVYAATTVGEETTMRGAHWAGSAVAPNVAIAVDVTYAQDYPGTDPNESGNVKLGRGPVICNSSIANKKVNDLLKICAKDKDIPYQVESFVGRTGTDADKIHFVGNGVVTALLSLPLRYMHSPAEVCDLSDIENSIELLAEFLCRIDENTSFDPFQ
ncbi:MAG: M20/M25/M40 family metallo-hydrolase [Oscillospiraceae bacterium]|nr:M20/M25/M40 family metallo-hydrolase [Oscillospiraceae bacterium]MBR2421332.1 M20/M25/M40 family metallo-hydrolase [Oscillospiraceae bacterium]